MRKTLILLISAALVAIVALPALAGGGSGGECITLSFDGNQHGAPGSSIELDTETVTDSMAGKEGTVTGQATNVPSSVHTGNNIVISSNGSSVTLFGVEDEADDGDGGPYTVEANGTLLLGSELTATLVFGQDGEFSAGFSVTICTEEDEFVFPVASIGGICVPDEETGVEIPAFLVSVQATSPIDNIAVVDDDGLLFGELEGSYAAGESRSQVVAASAVTGPLRLLYASEPIQTLELPPALDCGDEEPATTSTTAPQVDVSSTVVTTSTTTQSEILPFTGVDAGQLALIGMALLVLGALVLLGGKARTN